ncbi:MAG: hydantoinase B/oxoprolinase family protein, partial [Candidatus Bathyarchaeota archaeon]
MPVDPITVEVIKGSLVYVADEMGLALRNSAYSPNIKERMDHSCSIFDGKKRLAAQAEHIPVHLGSMQLAVQEGLGKLSSKIEEGDMVLFNDPYISGTHLPDLTLINPTFYDGEVIAYSANKAHHSDVGGKTPGSMAGDSTEIYQEGIIIPPVRFMKKGRIDKEIADILDSNIRTGKICMGDLRAQIAANLRGNERILEIINRYGVETLRDAMDEIMRYSEKRMAVEISKMPKGDYTAIDYLENIGTYQRKVKIQATVTIDGDRLKIDYSGTDEQVNGPVNAVLGVTLSGVYFVLRCL